MKNKMRNNFITYSLSFACILVLISSCKKALDLAPEDKLDGTNAYKTVADADAAVIGIYGKFAALGKEYVLMNELRADLVDVTENADPYLQQITNHDVKVDNPYISPRPFYEVIANCNDALKNFKIMVKESRMSVDEYEKRYSDIGALRSWLYFQMGIQYGSIPYITKSIENVNDLKSIDAYPKISFDVLLDSLITFTEALPYKESYAYPATSTLVFTADGSSTNKVFINKPYLLGDLNLWKGNYYKAAQWYKKIMSAEDNSTNLNVLYDSYRIIYSDSYAEHTVSYLRSQEESSLVNSPTTGWRAMFSLPNTNRSWNTEWVWSIPYNSAFLPGNPFIELCSASYGKYMIKPSNRILNLWNSQAQSNGIPYDARGVLSVRTVTGKPEIRKFIDADDASPLTLINRGGSWNITRAAAIHLKFAEAANRDGQSKLGWALLNQGIQRTFYQGTYVNGSISPATLAELNTEITPYPEGSPYYFDARLNTAVARGLWYRNIGVRTRANMPDINISFQTDMIGLESKLIEESARELAFEGSRWQDLMRVARRRNDPSFLADRVYDKLLKDGNPNAGAVRTKLMDPANWYLPFKMD